MKGFIALVLPVALFTSFPVWAESTLQRDIQEVEAGLVSGDVPKDGGYLGLGGLYGKLGNTQKEREQYQSQISLFPASEFSRQADYRLKKMVNQLPENPCDRATDEASRYTSVGMEYASGKGAGAGLSEAVRRTKAVEYFEKALYLSPNYQPAIRELVTAYGFLKSLEHRERIIELKKRHINCQQDPDDIATLKISLLKNYEEYGMESDANILWEDIRKNHSRSYALAQYYVADIPMGILNLKDKKFIEGRDKAAPILNHLLKTHVEGEYFEHFHIYQDLVISNGYTGKQDVACELAYAYLGKYRGQADNLDTANSWIENLCEQSLHPDVKESAVSANENIVKLEKLRNKPWDIPALSEDFFDLLKRAGKAGRWDLVFHFCRWKVDADSPDGASGVMSVTYPLIAAALRSGSIKPAREQSSFGPVWAVVIPFRDMEFVTIAKNGTSRDILDVEEDGYERRILIRIPLPQNIPVKTLSEANLSLYTFFSLPYEVFACPVDQDWVIDEVTWEERGHGHPWSKPGGSIREDRKVPAKRASFRSVQMFDLTDMVRKRAGRAYLNVGLIERKSGPNEFAGPFSVTDNSAGNQFVMLFRAREKPDVPGVIAVQDTQASLYLEGLRRLEKGDFANALLSWRSIKEDCKHCKWNASDHIKLLEDHLKGRAIDVPGYPWPDEDKLSGQIESKMLLIAIVIDRYAELARQHLKLLRLRLERVFK